MQFKNSHANTIAHAASDKIADSITKPANTFAGSCSACEWRLGQLDALQHNMQQWHAHALVQPPVTGTWR